MSLETADLKEMLRREFRALRQQHQVRAQTPLLQAALAQAGGLNQPGKRLGLYWPIGAEPDLRPVAEVVTCALPVVEGEQLRYRPWQPGEPLTADACGIPAPAQGAALDPSGVAALLVPALALDQHGIRLGSGGGWYDRLRADPAWRAIPALAVLPAACITRDLPRDPWDVPFDGWLDERGLHWLQAV